jgi:hypothetical protein
MLAREVALLAAQPGDGDCALPFQKPDHRRNRMFGGNRDAHVHMVRHKVTFNDLTLLLPSQRVEDCTQLSTFSCERPARAYSCLPPGVKALPRK